MNGHLVNRYFFPLLALASLQLSCSADDANVIEVKNGGEPYYAMMYLNREHWRWSMTVLENTLNDTAKIGVMSIPPGKTGVLFVIDCKADSIPFSYQPYRATQGRLVVEYSSGRY